VDTEHRATVRRYLLGEATDQEREALEREYFEDESALSRVEAEEETLIEEYLAERLNVRDRELFQERYLASPIHRQRVDAIRRLSAMSASGADAAKGISRARVSSYQWLALAAALILAAGAAWVFTPGKPVSLSSPTATGNRPSDASAPSSQPSPRPSAMPPATAPRVFAFSLPPISTRSADEAPRLVIPHGTDVVSLQLEGTGRPVPLNQTRAEIRRVTGEEAWSGPAISSTDIPSGTLARIDVPAARLPADDYIVTLFETPASASDRELNRYFLRVR
jgi:hypothetical protein